MLIKCEEELHIKRGSWINIRKILSDITLISQKR